MIKHVIGFALFVFIIACGVMVYAFLYTPPMPQIEEVKIPVAPGYRRPVELKKEIEVLSYELHSFTVDLEKRKATIDVTLEWNWHEDHPAGLVLDFGLTTADRPFAVTSLGYQNFSQPFANGNTVRRTFVLDLKDFAGLSPKETYYGYMGATDIAEARRSSVPLVYTEKNRMIGSVPALVRYPLKK